LKNGFEHFYKKESRINIDTWTKIPYHAKGEGGQMSMVTIDTWTKTQGNKVMITASCSISAGNGVKPHYHQLWSAAFLYE